MLGCGVRVPGGPPTWRKENESSTSPVHLFGYLFLHRPLGVGDSFPRLGIGKFIGELT